MTSFKNDHQTKLKFLQLHIAGGDGADVPGVLDHAEHLEAGDDPSHQGVESLQYSMCHGHGR